MKLNKAIDIILEEIACQRKELGVNHQWFSAKVDLEGIRAIHERRLNIKEQKLHHSGK